MIRTPARKLSEMHPLELYHSDSPAGLATVVFLALD